MISSTLLLVSQLSLAVATGPSAPPSMDSTHCVAAAAFLRGVPQMVAEIEADTIKDWRSGQEVVGCRITAVGGTAIGVNREAVRFYERVRAAGWTRTPNPRDAPNEASLRFRWEQSDCLFNVNREAMLFTDAEDRVNEAFLPKPGEQRYHLFVICLPVLPAKPNEFGLGPRLLGGAFHVAQPERRHG